MDTVLMVVLGVVVIGALVPVIIAFVTAATTSSYDKSLTGNPGDED